jgi:hypothetical protein
MKVGDYVMVMPGVYDERMPKDRRDGLVVQITGELEDQVLIMFLNKSFLKFHISQVKIVSMIEHSYKMQYNKIIH